MFAKKKMLVPASAMLLAACASTPKTPVFDANASAQAQAAHFIADNGKTKYMSGVKKVAVLGCNVLFAETSSASASTGEGIFGYTPKDKARVEAKTSVLYTMAGISDADMQRMTNSICADAENRLKTAGLDVTPTSELMKNEAFQQLLAAGKASPFNYKAPGKGSKTNYKIFAPNGYTVYDLRYLGSIGGLGQAFKAAGGNSAAQLETRVMKQLDVSAVTINIMIDFAKLESDGMHRAGSLTNKDNATVKHGVSLGITGLVDIKPVKELKCWKRFGKDECMLNVVAPTFNSKNAVTTNEQFYKAIVNTTTTADKATGMLTTGLATLSALGGVGGGSSVNITRYRVDVDAEQFEKLSRKSINGFMDMTFYAAKSRM